MRQKEVEDFQHKKRDRVPPSHPAEDAVCDARNQSPLPGSEPTPRHYPHVSILVVLMCLGVSRRRPRECSSEDPILDRSEISVRLDHHYELNVDGKAGFRPQSKGDEGVEQAGHREGQVVVFEVVRSNPQQKETWKWIDEDAEADGGIVHHAAEVTDFLAHREVRPPELWV